MCLARLEQETEEEEIANLQRAVDIYKAAGTELGQPRFLAALADAYRKTGQPEQGLNLLAEALAEVDETDERRDEAELYRLKGELLLAQAGKRATGNGQRGRISDP
jgi:tetratricopeptide (TPR) repeat protein